MRDRAAARDYLVPGLLVGLPAGAVSTVPVICLTNLCGCTWPFLAGFATAALVRARLQRGLAAPEGALGGLVAGLGAAGAATVVLIATWQTHLHYWHRVVPLESLEQLESDELILSLRLLDTPVGLILVALHVLFAAVIFASLGGLLGAALFPRLEPKADERPA